VGSTAVSWYGWAEDTSKEIPLYKLIKLQSGAGSPVFVNPARITSVQSWGDRETSVYFDKDHMLIIDGSVVETVQKLTV
jgi:hypothetical protein